MATGLKATELRGMQLGLFLLMILMCLMYQSAEASNPRRYGRSDILSSSSNAGDTVRDSGVQQSVYDHGSSSKLVSGSKLNSGHLGEEIKLPRAPQPPTSIRSLLSDTRNFRSCSDYCYSMKKGPSDSGTPPSHGKPTPPPG